MNNLIIVIYSKLCKLVGLLIDYENLIVSYCYLRFNYEICWFSKKKIMLLIINVKNVGILNIGLVFADF